MRHGQSQEFADHRLYEPGDEPRLIDWRAFARTDKPYVKRHQAESQLSVQIVLDDSASMRYQGSRANSSKWDYARALAVALTYLCVRQGDAVGLRVLSMGHLPGLPAVAAPRQWERARSWLTNRAASGGTQLGERLRRAVQSGRGPTWWVVITDALDSSQSMVQGVASLRTAGPQGSLLVVNAPDELDFPFQDQQTLVDLETQERLECQATWQRTEYLQALQADQSRLRRACLGRGLELGWWRTDVPVVSQLRRWLIPSARVGELVAGEPTE